MKAQKISRNSIRTWAFGVVYAASLTWMYLASTPEVAGDLSEREQQGFHVAAVKTNAESNSTEYVGYTLAQLRRPGLDLSRVSFLLPEKVVEIPGGDIHRATVLESHSSWQLVEYDYGNTHSSISRYRAFRERIEPVSYRITFHPGIVMWAIVLLIPAFVAAALMNWIWQFIRRKKKTPATP